MGPIGKYIYHLIHYEDFTEIMMHLRTEIERVIINDLSAGLSIALISAVRASIPQLRGYHTNRQTCLEGFG